MTTKRHRAKGGTSFHIYDAEWSDSSEMVVMSSDAYDMDPRERKGSLTFEPIPHVEQKVRHISMHACC